MPVRRVMLPVAVVATCVVLSGAAACVAPAGDTTPAPRRAAGAAPRAAMDSTHAAAATTAPASGDALVARFGPFQLDSGRFTVEVARAVTAGGDTTARHITVRDASESVSYEEDLARFTADDDWVEVGAQLLEDAAGHPRALMLDYGFYPSAPGSGEDTRILVPRGGKLEAITPMFSVSGEAGDLSSPNGVGHARLRAGDVMPFKAWRLSHAALIPIHVDLACRPAAGDCLHVVLPDSIAGLARFPVEAQPRAIEDTATIALFARPNASRADSVRVGPRTTVVVVEGAARVGWGRETPGFLNLEPDDDWLHVRVDGRDGWIHGDHDAMALGFPLAG